MPATRLHSDARSASMKAPICFCAMYIPFVSHDSDIYVCRLQTKFQDSMTSNVSIRYKYKLNFTRKRLYQVIRVRNSLGAPLNKIYMSLLSNSNILSRLNYLNVIVTDLKGFKAK